MNIMRKLKPSKEILLQYLYDYGFKETGRLLHLTEDEIEAILYPNFKQVNEHKFVYNTSEIKANVAKVIAENYNQLRSKFVGNTQYLQLSQTDEDLFHNTLLKVISEGIEDNILEQIEYRIKMLRFQLTMDNKQLKGIYANSEQTEKAKSEQSEYQ